MQVSLVNDGPVTLELESPLPKPATGGKQEQKNSKSKKSQQQKSDENVQEKEEGGKSGNSGEIEAAAKTDWKPGVSILFWRKSPKFMYSFFFFLGRLRQLLIRLGKKLPSINFLQVLF